MEEFFGFTTNQIVEAVITVASLAYVILIAYGRRMGWWFGVAASLLSVWLFIEVNLFAESILYIYYVVVGVYGYFHWKQEAGVDARKDITTRPLAFHCGAVVIGCLLAVALAQGLDRIGSSMIYADAFTTIFSFIATWMVTQRILENWIYWIVIDAFSVWLYNERGLPIYALLMGVYTILASGGFYLWLREYRKKPPRSTPV